MGLDGQRHAPADYPPPPPPGAGAHLLQRGGGGPGICFVFIMKMGGGIKI